MYSINKAKLKDTDVNSTLVISLGGILPEVGLCFVDTKPLTQNFGLCLSISSSSSVWKISAEAGSVVEKLCLTVGATVRKIVKKVVRHFGFGYKRAKTAVLFTSPRFLRL